MSTSAETLGDVASVLGLRETAGGSTLDLVTAVEAGLPVAAVDRLSSSIAPGDAAFKFLLVPKATLARRRGKKGARLSPEGSARVARVAEVWTRARDVWKDDEAARAFLFRPHPLLSGRTPIATALGTDLGARLVGDILGRLEHGTAP